MVDVSETFNPPPEAPVFEPTPAEFADPLHYIAKIWPAIEKVGICKIRPPQDWQPPFAVDVDSFRFTPRVQKINELEATSRVKLNFLDRLLKYWELQGVLVKIPYVDRKLLDFYKLHKFVQNEGGYDVVSSEKKWSRIANRMNLSHTPTKCFGSSLKTHYKTYLWPFDLFEAGLRKLNTETAKPSYSMKAYKPKKAAEEQVVLSADPVVKIEKIDNVGSGHEAGTNDTSIPLGMNENAELKKLQFFGAGPKATVPVLSAQEEVDKPNDQPRWKMRDRSSNWRASYLETDICRKCDRSDNEAHMLICNSCEFTVHMHCLQPPLEEMPRGQWRCQKCIAKEYNKPREAFGFEQSTKEYSLPEFGEMADQFKATYFGMPAHVVPCSMVEKEFWRLTTCLDEDVSVQYGADIHALEKGSGFPTKSTHDLHPDDAKYVTSKWNLNNLPIHDNSVLKYVSGDVSGMKVPWMYVGMCFSSFCWHIEDHWSYSINYLHWGEPKTWYGVPSSHAEGLEEVMRSRAPELFEQSPDLLHHITTIINPNLLMSHGIPVVRTNQCAGEFVVTCPRAYHAGFNQGYNFAEAVNFCPADWLPMGRACVNSYKLVKRQCVFSHEELICTLALESGNLDINVAAETLKELLCIIEIERQNRENLLRVGIGKQEREAFECRSDDDRQCDYCKTTCFLSAVTCPCKTNIVGCLEHALEFCSCKPDGKCLRYKYTMEELSALAIRLKTRSEMQESWNARVRAIVKGLTTPKPALADLKTLLHEAKDGQYADMTLVRELQHCIREAEQCTGLALQLANKKARARRHTELSQKSAARRLGLQELETFLVQVHKLRCSLKETDQLEGLVQKARQFQSEARLCIADNFLNTEKICKLYQDGSSLDLDLEEVSQLESSLEQAKWFDEVKTTLNDPESLYLDDIRNLIDRGAKIASHPCAVQALQELQDLIAQCELWEQKARDCLQTRPPCDLSVIQSIVTEAKSTPVFLPTVASLEDAIEGAAKWSAAAASVLDSEQPSLDVLLNLRIKANNIPIRLGLLCKVESAVQSAKLWKARATVCFLKENSVANLLEVLLPRCEFGKTRHRRCRKKQTDTTEPDSLEKAQDPSQFTKLYSISAQEEVESFLAHRSRTIEKHQSVAESKEVKSCLCQGPKAGDMWLCSLCSEFFHCRCVSAESQVNTRMRPILEKDFRLIERKERYLCPLCQRSRRPNIEEILQLLVALERVPVRLIEGEALQCLTERVIAWQDKAKPLLGSPELAAFLTQTSLRATQPDTCQGSQNTIPTDTCQGSDSTQPTEVPSGEVVNQLDATSRIVLSAEVKSQLERLLLEGDLLEVTLNETQQIWSILQASERNAALRQQPFGVEPTQVVKDTNSSAIAAHFFGTTDVPVQEHSRKRRDVENLPTDGPSKRSRQAASCPQAEHSDIMIALASHHTGTAGSRTCRVTTGDKVTDSDSDSDEDYDDYCSARPCLQPDGDEVDWVQCDTCQLWFHLACLGLSKSVISETEDFQCSTCSLRVKPDSSAGQMAKPQHGDSCVSETQLSIRVSSTNCAHVTHVLAT